MSRTEKRQLPGNPASAVYGTIVVAGQLAVESSTHHSAGAIVGTLAATLAVFWLAHGYTDALGGVIAGFRRESPPSMLKALREEWPIVESGVLPVVVLLLCVAFGAHTSTASTVALVVTVVELVGWAALAARRMPASTGHRIAFTVLAGVLGLAIVGLKYLLH